MNRCWFQSIERNH